MGYITKKHFNFPNEEEFKKMINKQYEEAKVERLAEIIDGVEGVEYDFPVDFINDYIHNVTKNKEESKTSKKLNNLYRLHEAAKNNLVPILIQLLEQYDYVSLRIGNTSPDIFNIDISELRRVQKGECFFSAFSSENKYKSSNSFNTRTEKINEDLRFIKFVDALKTAIKLLSKFHSDLEDKIKEIEDFPCVSSRKVIVEKFIKNVN